MNNCEASHARDELESIQDAVGHLSDEIEIRQAKQTVAISTSVAGDLVSAAILCHGMTLLRSVPAASAKNRRGLSG
ncbi:unnamed protein product [Gadus morhua 'NCC']